MERQFVSLSSGAVLAGLGDEPGTNWVSRRAKIEC